MHSTKSTMQQRVYIASMIVLALLTMAFGVGGLLMIKQRTFSTAWILLFTAFCTACMAVFLAQQDQSDHAGISPPDDAAKASSPAPMLTDAVKDVLAERTRQKKVLAWCSSHDDQGGAAVLAIAAGCYALFAKTYPNRGEPPPQWPWDAEFWEPSDFREDCKCAAAFLIAAMESTDRRNANKALQR